jgi:peptidoglycan/xylan/chitin deacetylase (PgdA/CDA1 family)
VAFTTKLHKLVSPLLHGSGIYHRHWKRRAGHGPFTVVLIYHRVVPDDAPLDGRFGIEKGISAAVFEAQLRFMLKRFLPIRLAEVLEPSSGMHFAVSLDDGYEDNFQVAAPILRRLGVPATFYVVSDFVGTDRLFWWEQLAELVRSTPLRRIDLTETLPDLVATGQLEPILTFDGEAPRQAAYEHLSAAIRNDAFENLPVHMSRLTEAFEVTPRQEGRAYGLMNWQQLRDLIAQGHEIGGHTASHCNVVGLGAEALQREVIASHTTLQNQLDSPVRSFAYPYGNFERDSAAFGEALAATGCRLAFTSERGVVNSHSNALQLPRACLNRRYPFACAFNVQQALLGK